MKICPEMKTRLSVKLLILFCSLSPALVHGQARPPVKPRPPAAQSNASELAALRALMKRVNEQSPRPPKVSATQVTSNGYWEKLELNVAWYGIMRRFLPTVRGVHPELLNYWVARTENGEGSFAIPAHNVVASIPALAPWADPLKSASDALIRESKQATHITISGAPEEERAAMRRALDLEGKRRDLLGVVRGIMGAAGEIGADDNRAWQPIYRFLKKDADEQWNATLEDRNKKREVAFELRKTFWEALNPPAAATAHFQKLEVLDHKLDAQGVQLLVSALSPGQTPMAFLEGDARELIDNQIEFDHELVRALDSPEMRADPTLIRGFDGLYSVWASLERREGLLQSGRWTQSVGMLMKVARLLLMAESWEWNEVDPENGRTASDFAVQRAGQTIDLLDKYRDDRRKPGAPADPLYAIAEVDDQGRILWSHSGWILWKWITAADLDDLVVDGRVVQGIGRRWLLPAGSPVRAIRSLQDVHDAKAREVMVGLDPAGAWVTMGARRVTP